jgi:DNA-binding PucR family transcriptional regulator
MPEERDARTGSPRWASQAVARSSGRPERNAFVVSRERDLLALLDASGGHPPRLVLERAASTISQAHGAILRAGVGTPFSGLGGFSASYQEARRALKHAGGRRPFVFGPDDVLLFDELTAAGSDDDARLIPDATRRVLADDSLRATVEAFFEADLNVAAAARSLTLHPNTLRYRLGRITDLTGRDPRNLKDLLELITSTRLITSSTRAADPGPASE